VQIQRSIERFCGLEDRPVVGVVEVLLAGAAEEEGAVEAQLGHRALELLGGGSGGGQSERRKALEPVPVGADELRDPVVGLRLQARGLFRRQVVETR
jgi:hypothetical protein